MQLMGISRNEIFIFARISYEFMCEKQNREEVPYSEMNARVIIVKVHRTRSLIVRAGLLLT